MNVRECERTDGCSNTGAIILSASLHQIRAMPHEMEHNHEGTELKELIRALHENGIEVILDVVFNHTAEGNAMGPMLFLQGL